MTLPSRLKRCRTTPSRSGLRRHSRASTTPTSTSATSKFQEARSRYFQIRFVSLAGLVSINFLIHLSSCRCHITTFRIRRSFTLSLQVQNLPLQQILPILNRLLHFLIHALVHSRIDYCNSALAGVAKVYLQKLQSVQNMAARMLPGVRRSEHVTPVLEDLHWLPVSQRVVFKTALMVRKCVHGVAPAYLSDLCIPALLPSQVVSICDKQWLALYWFPTPGLQLDNEVSQSMDQPHETVCHQQYGHWTCRRVPSSGHWRRTYSRLPGAVETSSWFWR